MGVGTVVGGRRVVLAVTGLAIGVLAGVLAFLSWERADQVAGVVSAFVSLAALGASVYAVLSGSGQSASSSSGVRVSRTGKATASGGGTANTGVVTPSSGEAGGPVSVERTGDAESDGGSANTGFRQGP
ncbi:hypothetical protein [Streptomyces sp. NPDC046887]|uniref:hypothetical protein n=1 Tax=Streptomyces sp. NPDC046887 TaxID=3155472 RepID=UPI003408E4AF